MDKSPLIFKGGQNVCVADHSYPEVKYMTNNSGWIFQAEILNKYPG